MKDIFALDVGSGTQDALLSDDKLTFKAKLVLPAPTQLFAAKIRRSKKDIFCDGYTMGGGAISGTLTAHAEKYRVVMTPDAARTVRDDPEQVRERGIEIADTMEGDHMTLTLKDVDMDAFRESLSLIGYTLPKPEKLAVAIAVQDHGVAPEGRSDREFRFETIGKKIRDYIERLADATLKNEEVFEDGGHGAYVKEPVKPKAIIVSGPRRRNVEKTGLDVKYAMPLDDVYMVGPVGMIRAYQEIKKE